MQDHINSVLADIDEHIVGKAPEEACGIVGLYKGKIRYYPCTNVAHNPLNDFVLNPQEFLSIKKEAEVLVIVHSHPGTSNEPSTLDRAVCDRVGVPWAIFTPGDLDYFYLEPVKQDLTLTGRQFIYGATDCFTLIKDYYDAIGIHLSDYNYEWDFWSLGKNYYVESYEKEGFHKVKSPKVHDLLLMNIGSKISNHSAIFVGKGKILQHLPDRLSGKYVYDLGWQNKTTHILRHDKFL